MSQRFDAVILDMELGGEVAASRLIAGVRRAVVESWLENRGGRG